MLSDKLVKSAVTAVLAMTSMLLVACDSGSDQPASASPTPAPTGDAEVATEALQQDDAPRAVVSDQLPYAEVEEELVYGYFVFPSDMIESLPAVIMIHGRWGLDDQVRAWADQLASEGYVVLAVDLFKGKTTRNPAEARDLMTAVVEDPDMAEANIRSAVEFVGNTTAPPRTGILGWGFGGTWAANTAMQLGDGVDATVVFYGQVTSDEDKLRTMSAPLLGLFGAKDRVVSAESVQALEEALQRIRSDYEMQVYSDAKGGFANPSSNNYNAAAADDAWSRMLEFMKRHLSEGEGDS